VVWGHFSGPVSTLLVALSDLIFGLYLFYGLLEAMRSRVLLRIRQRFDA